MLHQCPDQLQFRLDEITIILKIYSNVDVTVDVLLFARHTAKKICELHPFIFIKNFRYFGGQVFKISVFQLSRARRRAFFN